MTICRIAAERHYIAIDGLTISYLDWAGTGPVVLLLHGITSSAETLWHIGGDLTAAGRRVIAIDMPGHGLSDVSADHHIPAIAAVVGGLIEQLALRDVTLIGHSWGGATALTLAGGAHPAAAALACVALIDPAMAMNPVRGAEVLPGYTANLGKPFEELLEIFRSSNPDWHDCDIYWKSVATPQCRYAQVAGFFSQSGEWALADLLAAVPVPLLLLVADAQYTVIPPDRLAEVRARLAPGFGRMLQIPGTTHNMLRGLGYEPTMQARVAWRGDLMPEA